MVLAFFGDPNDSSSPYNFLVPKDQKIRTIRFSQRRYAAGATKDVSLKETFPMQSYLETPRTRLRPFAHSDAEAAFSWMSDTEVMRFIPLGPDATLDQTCARISRYIEHQETHGFSKWIILDRESRQPIGDSGFFFLPDGKRVELGYRLRRSHWGLGLATEVATRWIEVAGDFLPGETLYAFAHPENLASLHVMTKVGFTYFQNETFYGLDAPLYSLEIENKS